MTRPAPAAAVPGAREGERSDPVWRPMDTAPRDGTKILVWTIHGDIELSDYYRLEHDVYEEAGDGLYRKERRVYHEGWNSNFPVRWMPLPHPPADAEEAQEEARRAAPRVPIERLLDDTDDDRESEP